MQEMTVDQLKVWCAEKGMRLAPPSGLSYSVGDGCRAYSAELPTGFDGRVAVARAIMFTAAPQPFEGAIVWLSGWGMGDEVVGPTLYDCLRTHYGLSRAANSEQVVLFEAGEADACLVFLALFTTLGWDVYYLPMEGSMFALVSNDGFVDTVLRDGSRAPDVLSALSDWKVAPLAPGRNRYCDG